MKTCRICLTAKPVTEFHKQASMPDGHDARCKLCRKPISRDYHNRNRSEILTKQKLYVIKNNDIIKKKRDEKYIRDREKIKAASRKYYEKNKKAVLARAADYRKRMGDSVKDNIRARRIERYAEDEMYCLRIRVSTRVRAAIRRGGYTKQSKTHDTIGCSYGQLVSHIESMFDCGMSWENRGSWEIDHIIPLASATTENELLRLCHYTNMQPLWACDNRAKSDKLPSEL